MNDTETKIDWAQANCIGQDPEMFMDHEHFPLARKVCGNCPLAADCYYEAVKDGLQGCWGGYWHGKASAGVNPNRVVDRRLIRMYQAELCVRFGMTVQQFLDTFGYGTDGMRVALRSTFGRAASSAGRVR